MNCRQNREQFVSYLRRELADPERRAVEVHLAGCDACRLALRELEDLLAGLDQLPEHTPSARLRERFHETLEYAMSLQMAGRKGEPVLPGLFRSFRPSRPRWAMAYTLAVLLCGLIVGRSFPGGNIPEAGPGNQPQLAQIRQEVSELRDLMALTLLSQDSVQARLKGIEYARKSGSKDPRILTLLLNTVERDETRNVRLAALDVLASHLEDGKVREGIYNRLLMEPSPLVQLKIVELLLDHAGDGGRGLLDELLQTGILDPSVAGYLRQAESAQDQAGPHPVKIKL